MQHSNVRGQNKSDDNYDSSSEEEILESGLYCDFGPRRPATSAAQEPLPGLQEKLNSTVVPTFRDPGPSIVGDAIRRGSYNLFQYIRGRERSSNSLVDDFMDTESVDDRSCFSENFIMPKKADSTKSTTSNSSTPQATMGGAKPRRRRGSDAMGGAGGQKLPTSAELMAQKAQGYYPRGQAPQNYGGETEPMEMETPPVSMKPTTHRMSRAVPSTTNNATSLASQNAASSTATGATATKVSKPRRRRGSDAMGGAGGQKLPTSAELMAQKAMATNAASAPTAASAVPSAAQGAATAVKTTSAKPRRRRGSDAMGGAGGQKLPTSAELMAQKAMAANATATTIEASSAPTTMKVKSNKPRGRRGSHAMQEGMMTGGYTAAPPPQDMHTGATDKEEDSAPVTVSKRMESTATKTNRMKYVPPPSSAVNDNADATMDEPTSTIKTSKPRSSPSAPHTMPEGQMQKLSVTHQPVATTPTPPASTAASGGYDYPPGDYGPSPSKPAGHTRARRRGSVVKTMIGVEKDVDGDGKHFAQASATSYSPTSSLENNASPGPHTNDVDMMAVDNHCLPQRRSSNDGDGAGNAKKPMLKQKGQTENSSKNGVSEVTPNGGGESGKRVRKKKDIGRKAIRSMAGELDYVHKVIPKSNDAKELIYDAIKPNILFRACSLEELIDLVDAFEPKYVGKGSVVIQEGDEGDHFYVMERGGVDVFEKDVHKCSLFSGVAFGEIALLYGCPRSATVMAKYDCKLWVIDRRAFRGITAQHKRRRLELKLEFLKKVKIHDKVLGEILKPSEIHSMALATKIEKFKKGSAIVRQGERGDAFYMIEEGSVDVYIKEKGDKPLVTLESGSFFGEKALLSSDVRTATCRASSDVKCMLLMREDFVLVLGNLQDLLDRSYVARDEAIRAEQEAMMRKVAHPTTERFDTNDFDIKRTLGVGAFGFVKLVRWKQAPAGNADTFYALKCVSKEKIIQHKQQIKIKNEEDIMKEMVHPFIARCYSVMEDERGKYFLMEALCGGELCELLYHETQFSEGWSMFYSASVLAAFAHMHEHKVAYRDLKPENLVLDTHGFVKIVDFGLAKKITSGQTYTFCGTPDYLAPEVILNEGYDWAVDYWGLGVLIYEMTAGVAPFYAESPMETYEKVLSGHVHIPGHFSRALANLVKKLMHTSQSKRLGRTVGGATTVMCHPWFSGFDWDALLEYRMKTPYIPEIRDPDDASNAMDESETEGFAHDFL